MHRIHLPLTVVAVATLGCQSAPPTGSLAEIKHHQESRLAYECIVEHNVSVRGSTSLDSGYAKLELVKACREDADARVW
jgi:hypothetical protein